MVSTSVGKIYIRCHNCGAILYRYAIGDKEDKNKFNGPPLPRRALSGYDDDRCPVCRAPLSGSPKNLKFLTADEFHRLYREVRYRLVLVTELPTRPVIGVEGVPHSIISGQDQEIADSLRD